MATQYAKKIKFQDRTNRVSNSMSPSYELNGIDIRDSPRAKPRKLKAEILDSHLLQTIDIEGAQAGYITKHQLSIPLDQRREFRNTNYIGDINGSGADSVKHSIITKRELHPLQPVYQSLDGQGEVLRGCIEPLVPADCVKFDASTFKAHGVIKEINTDGTLVDPFSIRPPLNEKLDIITHQSLNSFRSNKSSPKSLHSGRQSSGGLFETGETFQGMGSGTAESMNFFDTSGLGESKSYAEKYSTSDLVTTSSRVPKLDTGASNNNSARVESKKSTSRSGIITPSSSCASSRKSSRSSVASRRAMAELEAEVNAIRDL